jgi:invasion protein IalB
MARAAKAARLGHYRRMAGDFRNLAHLTLSEPPDSLSDAQTTTTGRPTITTSSRIRSTLSRIAAPTLLLMVFGTVPASAQVGGEVRPGATHQDWQVVCEDTPAGENCFITQAAVDEKGEPVMQISVGVIEGDTIMVIYLPLGLDLRPGMLFQIGETFRREFPFQTCLPNGCRVVAQVDSEMMTALRGGNAFRVGVKTLDSDRVAVVEGSLMGFTAGFRAVSK